MIDDAYAMIGRWLGDDFFSNRLKSALFMEMVPYQVFNFYDFFFHSTPCQIKLYPLLSQHKRPRQLTYISQRIRTIQQSNNSTNEQQRLLCQNFLTILIKILFGVCINIYGRIQQI